MSHETADALAQFWQVAQRYAGFNGLEPFMRTSWSDIVPPPAWSFGDSPAVAEELLALVLDGRKTATSGLLESYEPCEPVPKAGDLSIVLDGAGMPQALIRAVEVKVLPFAAVTERQAGAEGEGDGSLASWRQAHREAWRRQGYDVTDDSQVVWERFEVLYPHTPRPLVQSFWPR